MPCEWDCAHSSGRAGWLGSHPPATLSCSPLPQHDPPPCAYSPSDSGRPSRQVGLRPAPAHSAHPLAHSKLDAVRSEPALLTFDTVSGSQCSKPPFRVKPQGAPPCSCTGTYWKDPGRLSILGSAGQAPPGSFSAGATEPPPPAAQPPPSSSAAPPRSAYSPGWRRSGS